MTKKEVNHHIAEHSPGSMFLLGSGNSPGTVTHPTWSAVVSREVEEAGERAPALPTAVAVPSEPSEGPGPGLLGPAYSSFATHADPSSSVFQVQSLSLPQGFDEDRLRARKGFLEKTDRYFGELAEQPSALLQGIDQFNRDAYQIILSPRTRAAFRIEQEPDRLRDRYGRFKLGQRLLLARRLVEAGVRFVTVNEPVGWDTHADNFARLRGSVEKKYDPPLPTLDQARSALVEDLATRGLLADTLVMVFGEFGRTPVINKAAGRDHWPQAMSIVLAGGGTPAGLQYGTTDRNGWAVTDGSHSPADFACTVYSLLGIDPHKEYAGPGGQRVPIVKGGKAIRAIVG